MAKHYNTIPRGKKDPQYLFDILNKLSENYPFCRSDTTTRFGTPVVIFSHFPAGHDEWKKPYARESRGILFEVSPEDANKAIRIMSRPVEKFFNWGENDISTFPVEAKNVEAIESKEDGSIISTYYDQSLYDFNGSPELFLKSKRSISSDVSKLATMLLNTPRYADLKRTLLKIALHGYTTNMEFVGPNNRIVLEYPNQRLIIFDIRDNISGLRVHPTDMEFLNDLDLKALEEFFVTEYDNGLFVDYDDDLTEEEKINKTKDIIKDYIENTKFVEGLIVHDKINGPFKIKTSWYTTIHRVKYSISSNRNLFESIVTGSIDDIRSLYIGEDKSLERIDDFNTVYLEAISKQITTLQHLLPTLVGLDRKTYAYNSQKVVKDSKLPQYIFSILMNCFDCEPDWDDIIKTLNEHFMKNYKNYVPEKYVVSIDDV